MEIKFSVLLFAVGGLVRVYKTFDPEIFWVVAPVGDPVSFASVHEAFDFAYSLYVEWGEDFKEMLKNDQSK